jgi:hypothetical protein
LTLDPGSRIGFFQIPNLGSETHNFDNLMTNFWVKSTLILECFGAKYFLYLYKNKIIYNFMIFVATINGRPKKFSPSFGAVVGSGIRDKHPGSATLQRS